MESKERDSQSAAGPEPDALGELIRAAGRRAAPPAGHYASVRAASRAAWQAKAVRRRRQRRLGYALAASVVLAIGVIASLRLLEPAATEAIADLVRLRGEAATFSIATGTWTPLAPRSAALYPGDRIRTGPTSGAAFALAGGVSLRLDSETNIRLTGPDALTLLAGKIYIDSGDTQRTRKLEIQTPHGMVSDIGTQFEVMASDATLRVRVRSGAVRVEGSELAADTGGAAGEELALTASSGLQRRPFAPHDAAWDWVQALAVTPAAGDASVREYLHWISKETGRPLRYDSIGTEARAELERVRGDPQGLMPIQLLDSITATTDFEYVLQPDGGILIRRAATAP